MPELMLERFKWSVQALAMAPEVQLRLFPDFVCKGDELALEWDQHYRALSTACWTPEQRFAASALEAKLKSMSRGGPEYEEALWLDDATLLTSPQWARVRVLAAAVLEAFAWPIEPPPETPSDRGSTYVGPDRQVLEDEQTRSASTGETESEPTALATTALVCAVASWFLEVVGFFLAAWCAGFSVAVIYVRSGRNVPGRIYWTLLVAGLRLVPCLFLRIAW